MPLAGGPDLSLGAPDWLPAAPGCVPAVPVELLRFESDEDLEDDGEVRMLDSRPPPGLEGGLGKPAGVVAGGRGVDGEDGGVGGRVQPAIASASNRGAHWIRRFPVLGVCIAWCGGMGYLRFRRLGRARLA